MGCRGLLFGLALTCVLVPTAARGDGTEAAERMKAIHESFKPLKFPAAAKIEKDVTPSLPQGIVTEARPFSDLIAKTAKPFEALLDQREQALKALAEPTVAEADALRAAWKTIDAESDDLSARVAAVEARYAEVYDLEWTAAGEKERTTRKLAAVLIPLYRGLLVREAKIAGAAGEALAGMKDAPGIAWLIAATATEPSPGFRAVAVDALGRIGGTEAGAALHKVASGDAEPPVRLRALAALSAWKISEMKDAVLAALLDSAWEVRALAVAMSAKARLVEATATLIQALEKEQGRLRQDIDDALFALVGVRMYADVAKWKKWLSENASLLSAKATAIAAEGAYDHPLGPAATWDTPGAAEASGQEAKGTTSAFYGIPTYSKRVLFVVDISKSMEEAAQAQPPAEGGSKDPYAEPKGQAKIQIARWQLHRAIAALPPDAAFGVIVFSESYRAWLPAMSEASPKSKAKAHEFVEGIVPNGTTNLADSLDKAFEIAGAATVLSRGKAPRPPLAVDTMYVLTDGDPNRGRVADLPSLLEEMVRRARETRVVIHAIGIGELAGSSFLASLAQRTGGRYVGFK